MAEGLPVYRHGPGELRDAFRTAPERLPVLLETVPSFQTCGTCPEMGTPALVWGELVNYLNQPLATGGLLLFVFFCYCCC